MIDNELACILGDIEQTTGVRRTFFKKGQIYVEGSFPDSELKRGKVPAAFIAAINRVRKNSKLGRLPLDNWQLDWHAVRSDTVEYRIVTDFLPKTE